MVEQLPYALRVGVAGGLAIGVKGVDLADDGFGCGEKGRGHL
jgi:hypothetical protein